jgi:hypothetical protein
MKCEHLAAGETTCDLRGDLRCGISVIRRVGQRLFPNARGGWQSDLRGDLLMAWRGA